MTTCTTERLPRESNPELRLALEFADGRRHSLPHCEPLTIGSAVDCDLRVPDRFVSCYHARVRYGPRGYVLEDLGSTNGTLVDGVRVGEALLAPGMSLEFGAVRFAVARIDQAEEAPPRPRRLVGEAEAPRAEHRMVGRSVAMRRLQAKLEKLAVVSLPVLIRGETGTGKELAAQTLHDFGPHADAPFVALNCAAIPPGLFESELFGHRRGAFTGAHRDHDGAFVRAGRGTVFLDEIGELPAEAQAKLLRVLETRRVTPVGHDRELEIRCRIVAATHRDLGRMISEGHFREDLYHRLGVVSVEIPPLRQRRADIPALLEHFVDLAAAELGREVVVSKRAAAEALAHPWPGNVRALRNAVLRAAALAEGAIEAEELIPHGDQPISRQAVITVPRGSYASMNAALLRQIVAEEGSIRKAARVLEVPRSTLGAWMQKL